MGVMEADLIRSVETLDASYRRIALHHRVSTLIVGSSAREFVGAKSRIVQFHGHYDAVVAFPWTPDGLPIRIYQYSSTGSWRAIAALRSPFGFAQGAIYLFSSVIPVGSIFGLSSPAFLIQAVGGGCFPGSVLTFLKGKWSLLSALNAANQESTEIGGNPTFRHGYLLTTTICGANPADTGNTIVWSKVDQGTSNLVVVRQEVVDTSRKASSDS